MRKIKISFFSTFIFCLIYSINSKINVLELPNLDISNFDVREKFRDCYFDGTSSNYNDLACHTNWPIQFTMMLTDKICLKKGIKRSTVLSSMNINTCMKLDLKVPDCRDLKNYYNDTETTFIVVNETINFFNLKGIQFLDEAPYKLLRDDESQPAYFPPCDNYNSSLPNITLKTDYDIMDETVDDDFKLIKHLIYEEGPLLAYIDSKKDLF
jgi:uncharacterized cysteine cluster protein YcgN (CxxCxxCC family)